MLSETEILLIHNSLNEVLNGLPPTIPDLATENLRNIAHGFLNPSEEFVTVHKELIVECVAVVLAELGDEFETRAGVSTEVAENWIRRNS